MAKRIASQICQDGLLHATGIDRSRIAEGILMPRLTEKEKQEIFHYIESEK
jgi:hypothetical protein